ncbi:MAG: 2-hydroxyacyl-CoA dehydratase family protein [Proteobacteria bacterium]|nr:2-hydroxyacyl-CoA dehydratase family protein [Pseudomonadota bacterium]
MNTPKPVETKGSRKSLETARNTWKFILEDYQEGHAHKQAGRPVIWSCAAVEKELFYAMGLFPYYPEQFAALCAVRRKEKGGEKEAVRFARLAEQAGYSADLCGYERVVSGYVINGDLADAPLGGMAPPDLMVTTSAICDVRLKWFEDMAQRLNVPLFTLDRPERVYARIQQHPLPHEVRYYRSQLEDFLSFVTEHTGIAYDRDRLDSALDWAYKANELRLELLELRKAVPSPMGCPDGFATIYPGMYCSGTEKAFEFYKTLRDEVKARVQAGRGQIENEKFRLLWYGIPLWFNMSIFNYFEDIGGVFAYEPAYNPSPWPARRPDDPLTEIATRTLSVGTSMHSMVESIVEQCREYRIAGGVLAYLLTCRPVYLPGLEIRRALEERLGIPSVLIECDLVDERSYSEGQVKTRLDAFGEQILKRIESGEPIQKRKAVA